MFHVVRYQYRTKSSMESHGGRTCPQKPADIDHSTLIVVKSKMYFISESELVVRTSQNGE